jgi:hypothetical protein
MAFFAENMKVSFAAAPLLCLMVGETGFLSKDVFRPRFFRMISKTCSLVTGSLIALKGFRSGFADLRIAPRGRCLSVHVLEG